MGIGEGQESIGDGKEQITRKEEKRLGVRLPLEENGGDCTRTHFV